MRRLAVLIPLIVFNFGCLNSNHVAAYNWFGPAMDYEDQGQYNLAIIAVRHGIEFEPGNELAWQQLGRLYREKGEYDESITAYRQATKLKPDDAGAWSMLGLCCEHQSKYDDAVIAYSQAVKLKPDDLAGWYHLGSAYSGEGKRSEAMGVLDHLRKTDPSSWATRQLADSLGVNELENAPSNAMTTTGNLAQTGTDTNSAAGSDVSTTPLAPADTSQTETSSTRGAGSVASNTPVASVAMEEIRKKAEAGDAHAQGFLFLVYNEGMGVPQDSTEAMKWLRMAVEQGDAWAQRTLGKWYEKGQGVPQDYIEAYKWYNLAASQGFAYAERWRDHVAQLMTREQIAEGQRRASEFVAQHEGAKARGRPDTGITQKPTSPASGDIANGGDYFAIFDSEEWKRVDVAQKAKDWVEKLKGAQALTHKFPDHPVAWDTLGDAYYDQGKLDDAVTAYREAIKLKPDFAEAWLLLGSCYQDQGKNDDAVSAYREAIKLKPDYSDAWFSLGLIYTIQGKRSEALDALDHLRKLDPSMADKLAGLLSPK
jgi:cytochrome c-type biogenesis protein CcmH/NrfG